MDQISYILLYFNSIFIPVYVFLRVKKNKSLAFSNPCFYLLISSYLYLTISSLFFELNLRVKATLLDYYLVYSPESLMITNAICNWFVFIFFTYYALSRDTNLIIYKNYKPQLITTKIAFFITWFIGVVFVAIIVIYGPRLLAIDFQEARQFVPFFNNTFRYRILSVTLAGSVAVLVWRTRKVKWFLMLVLTIIIDLLTRSRGRALYVIIFAYINYVVLFKKTRLRIILSLVFGIIFSLFLRKSLIINNFTDVLEVPLQLLGEVFNTRATTIIVYDHFLNQGSLIDYMVYSFTQVLPGKIGSLIENLVWSDSAEILGSLDYQNVIREYYASLGISWGLAGNIASEALYFGGIPFAIVSPFVIGGIFYLLYELRLYQTFPGFVFLSLLIAELPRGIMRNTFYDTFFTVFYIMFSYLIWISFLEGRRIIFKTSRNSSSTQVNPLRNELN